MRNLFKALFLKTFIIVEFLFLVLGVSLPLASIDEFWFFTREFSILSLALTLFQSREYVLSIIIITFGLIIPIMKIFQNALKMKLISGIPFHKFSMLDIFLLSILVFGGKLSYFYQVNLKLGFYFLVISVFLSYFSLILTKKL